MRIPTVSFSKYLTHLNTESLADYIRLLPALHKDYSGLSVSGVLGSLEPDEAAERILHPPGCPSSILGMGELKVSCGSFRWSLGVNAFMVKANAFYSVQELEKYYGDADTFLDRYTVLWEESGICDELGMGEPNIAICANAWSLYMSRKNVNVRLPDGQVPLLAVYALSADPERNAASDALRTMRERVERQYGSALKYDSLFSVENYLDIIIQEETNVVEIDSYLLTEFGIDRFANLVSAFNCSLDEWMSWI